VNARGVLRATGLGFGLGVVTGMPLAVVNMAIVDAATAGRRRFATGLGLGGGAADAIHAALAFTGVGTLVTANRTLVRGLAIAAAVVIIAYAVIAWRRRHAGQAERRADAGAADAGAADVQLGRGVATGFVLTLPNPAALGAWVAVAASVWPDAVPFEAALIAGGVGAGSALWFTLLARWIGRVRRDHPALTIVPRAALIVVIAIALVGVVRAL